MSGFEREDVSRAKRDRHPNPMGGVVPWSVSWSGPMTHRSNAAVAIGSLTSERTLLEQVRQLARMLGWMTYHPHLFNWSERGWPDVVVCRSPRVLFLSSSLRRAAPAAWMPACCGRPTWMR